MKKRSSAKKRKSPLTFISELKEELKKVSWTTKPELIGATKVVLIATICFGVGIYAVDFVIKGVLTLIRTLALFIFG